MQQRSLQRLMELINEFGDEFAAKLMQDTNEILDDLSFIYANGKLIGYAVNWSDLHCVKVEKFQEYDSTGESSIGWRILVENASPDARNFHKLVREKLIERGYYAQMDEGKVCNVEIVTRW